MNLNITGHNIEMTSALRSYVENKMERALRNFDRVIDASIVLRMEKVRHLAEAVVRVPNKDICVSGDEEDMYAAIDVMADKLDRQVQKHKGRMSSHQHESVRRAVGE